MNLDFISQKEILKQFKRKDLTDAQKSRYAIYLMDSAYKLGFEEHQNRLNHLLKDPFLNKKIHEFESYGYIKKVTSFVNSDRVLVDFMKNAHANYYYLRRNLYSRFFGDISPLEFNNKILTCGIGGIKEIGNIKCLHQHYSHYQICSDNVVGRIVHNLLNGINYCRERLCDDASQ